MEANARRVIVTAVAPVAWGSNYYVTRHFLPSGYPLYGAALRALPAGLLLLAAARSRPRGSWWWKSALLGLLNVGAFFVLVYISAQLLPSSVASPMMALSAGVMMLLAWGLLSERPRVLPLAGAAMGLGGVALMLVADARQVNPYGVLAAAAARIRLRHGRGDRRRVRRLVRRAQAPQRCDRRAGRTAQPGRRGDPRDPRGGRTVRPAPDRRNHDRADRCPHRSAPGRLAPHPERSACR